MSEFQIDLRGRTLPFPHYWEECVGSCHAAVALREDWRRQLERCHRELGFKRVRFHGLFDDDLSVCTGDPAEPYSFFNLDAIFDFLLGIGMKPLVELSFMPETLASGKQTCFHYRGNVTPPSDYRAWGELITRFAEHLADRYGAAELAEWPFEVWNEPNLSYFWSGTREEYFRLYQTTAVALKSVSPALRVGGPATACDAWIPEFISFCQGVGAPLDFVSTHHYPTDAPLDQGQNMEEAIAASKRGVLREKAAKARREAGSYPLYYTEWNSSPSSRDAYHDDPFAAAFIAKTIADNQGLAEIYSYWTFSDLFEEAYFPSRPFHGGFGLLNLHGIPKPSYHAFRLLHLLGDKRLPVAGEADGTVECLATAGDGQAAVLLHNHQIPRAPIREETVRLAVRGLNPAASATLLRIDEEHGNPKRLWQEWGAPAYLRPDLAEQLMAASKLRPEQVEWRRENEDAVMELKLPPHGVAGIFIEQAR